MLSRPKNSPKFHCNKSRMQALIKPECLDSRIQIEISIATVIPVIPEPDISIIN
jgi:hypothetical protein